MVRDRPLTMIGALESTTMRVSPARRTGRRSNDLICYINVTGFVSVMLVLVFMFAGPARIVDHPHGSSVDMARVSHTTPMRAALREDALLVAIMRDGKVFFRADRITIEELPARIREGVSQGAERRVYIKADARAKYGNIKEVLDSVHAAGIEKIGFLVDQRRPPASEPQ